MNGCAYKAKKHQNCVNPGKSAFVLMLKAIVRFINGTSGWPNLIGVKIVTNNINETLKHMEYYWQRKHPAEHTAADKADAPDSDCMMFAAFS